MSERDQAIAAWGRYCHRFQVPIDEIKRLLGFTQPGFEKFPVDQAMLEDIKARYWK